MVLIWMVPAFGSFDQRFGFRKMIDSWLVTSALGRRRDKCCRSRGRDTGSDGRARWQRTFSLRIPGSGTTNQFRPRSCCSDGVQRYCGSQAERLGRWRVSHGALRRRNGPEPPGPRRPSSTSLVRRYCKAHGGRRTASAASPEKCLIVALTPFRWSWTSVAPTLVLGAAADPPGPPRRHFRRRNQGNEAL